MQINQTNWNKLTNDSTKQMLSCKPLDEFKGLNLSPKDIKMSEEEKEMTWGDILVQLEG